MPFFGSFNTLALPYGSQVPVRIVIEKDSHHVWMWGLGFFGICCVGRFALKKYPHAQECFKNLSKIKNFPDYCVAWYLRRNGQVAMAKNEIDGLVQEVKIVEESAQQVLSKAQDLKKQNIQLQALLQEKQAEDQVARAQQSTQPKSLWFRLFGRDSSAQQSPSQAQKGSETILERYRQYRKASHQQTEIAFGQRGGAQIVELPDGDAHPRLAITPCVSSTALPLTIPSATPSSVEIAQTDPRLFGQTGINIAFNHQQILKKRTLLGSFYQAPVSRPLPKQIAGLKPGCLVQEATNRLGF